MTVARADSELELAYPEERHVCDPYGEFNIGRLNASNCATAGDASI
jgi:hypothetical protein